jgi:hypothetical protein
MVKEGERRRGLELHINTNPCDGGVYDFRNFEEV